MSLDTSNRSLVVPHGAEAAAAKVKAKPKVTDFVCSPAEVKTQLTSTVNKVLTLSLAGRELCSRCSGAGYTSSFLGFQSQL